MKRTHVILIILAAIVTFAAFVLVLLWPYRGFLPLLRQPPIDVADVPDRGGTSTERAEGENLTGLPLELPEGFSIDIYARDLQGPRVLQHEGTTLFASIPAQGKIIAIPDEDEDGRPEATRTLLENLERPHGFLFYWISGSDMKLAVAESDALAIYDYDQESIKAMNREKLFDLPDSGRHWTKTLYQAQATEGFDGPIFVSMGSSCDVCHESDPLRGSIQMFYPISGQELLPFATGLRNSVFMTRGLGRSDIWATEMGRDLLGDDLPPDEINVLELTLEGRDYGWPVCYGKNVHDTQFDKNVYVRDPCEDKIPSHIELPAHSAPLGLVIVPKSAGWPKEYEGNLLVAYHGSWNRTVPTGYKIARFVLDEDGNVLEERDFITGWLSDQGVLGRPVDIKFGPNGSLFISDDRAGVIYRVTPPGALQE